MQKNDIEPNLASTHAGYPEIPVKDNISDWKELPIQECGEVLVPLGPFSGYGHIFTDSIYWAERSSSPFETGELNGSLLTCFVREGIAARLDEAAQFLPERHAFLVWDTFRSLGTQRALFEDFRDQLVEKKGLSLEEATEEAQRFVSIPSTDPSRPSPHNTGASVDLTIIEFTEEGWQTLQRLEGALQSSDPDTVYRAEMERLRLLREESREIPMGTRFDEVASETRTRYYEELSKLTDEDAVIRDNRRMLVDVLQRVGMSNYHEEWWHFDYGNQFHAKRTGEAAIYGAAEFSHENEAHEKMRVNHYNGSQYCLGQSRLPATSKLDITDDTLKLVHQAAHSAGDLSESRHEPACRLEA